MARAKNTRKKGSRPDNLFWNLVILAVVTVPQILVLFLPAIMSALFPDSSIDRLTRAAYYRSISSE